MIIIVCLFYCKLVYNVNGWNSSALSLSALYSIIDIIAVGLTNEQLYYIILNMNDIYTRYWY